MILEPEAGHMVWLDGAFRSWRDATMHICDHHYGFGVFEGVRAYEVEGRTAVFRLDDHTSRLFRSARILNLRIPEQYDHECLNNVQIELLQRNHLRRAYLRPFIYLGGTHALSPRGRDLTVHVAVLALGWNGPDSSSKHAIAVRTSSFVRATGALLTRAKANANYMTAMLALQEARAAGADDAILLDQQGFVTEASAANLFVVRDGVLHTPPKTAALEGITRDTIIRLAEQSGIPCTEAHLTREDIYVADEAFLSGTAVGITPIREADGRRLGSGSPGSLTVRLQAMYEACVSGRTEHHTTWVRWV